MRNYLSHKILVPVALFGYCLYYTNTLTSWHFIDSVNLVIHEAGHVVFALFGLVLYIAGGSLLQLIVPIIFAVYFTYKGNNLATSVMLFWLAVNLFNISVYSGDALRMQLPLIADDPETHDWNQLLFTLQWLRHTRLISAIFFGSGVLVAVLALLRGVYPAVFEIKQAE